jgi:DNA repair exonuclease SbcCD ATPase subunit
MITLNTKIQTVSKIVHCADIHIRNVRRHTEYQKQFEKFYSKIKEVKDDTTIIYVGGDIVHAKTDMSPELIKMVSDFLSTLADIAPTVVIAGNHDANLNNPDRLDALSPIIANLNHSNLYYLRDTNLYQLGNVVFSVMSVFDDKSKYILGDDILGDDVKIALYHGPVTNSVTGVGFNIQSSTDVGLFEGFDYALLGDIHQYQYLNESKTVAYCSSLVQQNFGESYENHGFILWDLENNKHEFYHLDNEYGFHTLIISEGEIHPYKKELITNKSRVRVKVSKTPDFKTKELISQIKNDLNIDEISVTKQDVISTNSNIDITKNSTVDVRNIDTQNSLIRDYLNLTLNLDITGELLEKVFEINRKSNLLLVTSDEVIRNVIWKPKKFEFSNMFSYGENNIIDFSNLKGIQGLFGPNASGKSSLLDALCFCLFDTTSRAYKAEQILNTKKNWFNCKFNFEIDGVDYFIEKRGTKNAQGKVKVNIDFYCTDTNGDKKILNGEQRRDTNSIIKSFIGSYEDFTLMCLSIQNNGTNFVDKSQTERKEILAKFLDLNVFESLYNIANGEHKKIITLIDNTNSKELELDIESLKGEIVIHTKECDATEQYINNIKDSIETLNDEILSISKSIRNVEKLDINQLTSDKERYELLIKDKESKLPEITQSIIDINSKLDFSEKEYKSYDTEDIKQKYGELKQQQQTYGSLKNQKEKLEFIISSKTEKLKKLEEHEYDPNCKYCVNNVFVKDAIQTKTEIESDKTFLENVEADIKRVFDYIVNNTNITDTIEKVRILRESIDTFSKKISSLEIAKLTLEKDLLDYKNKLDTIESKIKLYSDNKNIIEDNKKIENDISVKKDEIRKLDLQASQLSKEHLELHSKIKVAESKIQSLQDRLSKISDLVKQKAAYEYYLKSMDKDGISYQLISKTLPVIENEINNILSNLVDFKIILNTDGKNVNAFIVYDTSYWPLELSSGMERFISAIAIRVGLINISSLPKPTFFAIDEGLGVLDSTNLNQMYLLFNYIREVFKFTMIISHIDVVRDMVDNTLTIDNKNGFSSLQLN